jgi:hypothetical protein
VAANEEELKRETALGRNGCTLDDEEEEDGAMEENAGRFGLPSEGNEGDT